MNNFTKLGLSQSNLKVLDQLGFSNPTPIQEKAIPLLLSKDPIDFIGLAQTGTGKTAAFGLPLIDLIDHDNQATQAIIMAPTRELGQQTAQQLKDLSTFHRSLNIEVVYGGAPITNQIKALKKPVQIVVATPGRLLDLIKRKAIHLQEVRYVILDEADEMLNMGFKEDIDKILSHTFSKKAIWLFSATMPPEIRRIIKKYMSDPEEIAINSQEVSNRDIAHKFVTTKTANKIPAIRRFMDFQPEMRGILFCRTKRETQQIADELSTLGYGVEALHGDLSQSQRDAVMKRFRKRSMQLLIATDVAARGIDVQDLTHVLHHTLPDQLEYYTHRSGRTGRAGKKGISLAFINPRENRKITDLEKKIKIKFERIEVPSLSELKSSRIHHWASLIVNTKVDDKAEEILDHLQNQFAHLSKEDLLKRLITTQLDHLMVEGAETHDLNETGTDQSAAHRGSNGFHRYFVNMGIIDGLTKGDLIHFLAEISGVDRQNFDNIDMKKNFSFFDMDQKYDSGISNRFKGIEIEGRQIRVNRDDQDPNISSVNKKKEKGRQRHPKHGIIRKRNKKKNNRY